jgi:lipoyl(octanoyl) transferase
MTQPSQAITRWPETGQRLDRVDLGEVAYRQAVDQMTRWSDERRAGLARDRLFLLSHPPVITYGRLTPAQDLPQDLGWIPTVPVDRGAMRHTTDLVNSSATS